MKAKKTIIREGKSHWAACWLLGLLVLLALPGRAQIRIGGNVYGGGNKGNVSGSTKVTVKAGDIGAVVDPNASRPLTNPQGKVFGGARMANVGGSSFVHIDGENATDYILINQVFGGNDIAGQIGTAAAVEEEIPTELTETQAADGTNEKKNKVDNTFNSYVRVSSKPLIENGDTVKYTAAEIADAANNPEDPAYGKTTDDVKPDPTAEKVYIGQLFGGGNGDYDYTSDEYAGLQLPEQNKTYLEIKGGSIVYGYGGGNNATVKEQTVIHFDNPSAVVNHILVDAEGNEADNEAYEAYEANEPDEDYTDLLSDARFKEMGINTTFSQPSSGAFQVGRFFGGNNKAEMSIRPTWNLLAGKIRNLYSGGNKGTMTSPEGLLLEIKDYSTLIVDKLYGGCRMADVRPTVNGEYVPCMNLEGYNFPDELSARVLVQGGHINNVYGGNDVTGTVYGGNAVGIYTTVYGDVYGGGNGAYPYSDAASMQNYEEYSDFNYHNFWYDIDNHYSSSIAALNAFRPNAEQVSLRLCGKDAANPTIIHGSVFLGGNCASLDAKKKDPMVELKMGSYVIANTVYLGNNGKEMLNENYLTKYSDKDFSTLKLTEKKTFEDYMEGVTMTLKPEIKFDNIDKGDPADYIENSSFIGSFYCGGNVGSMAIPGKLSFTVDHSLVIYDKFVGGSNNANVAAQEGLNAAYEGGVIGAADERDGYTDEDGNIKDRLEINLENLTLVPLRWNDPVAKDFLLWNKNKWGYVPVEDGETLTEGGIYYTSDAGAGEFTADGDEVSTGTNYFEQGFVPVPTGPYFELPSNRLLGANVYGGCYESGHVNGNVVININDDVVKKDEVFGTGTNFIGRPKSKIDFEGQREDLMAVTMSLFGGGYGEDTEIWGSTTINHNNGYAFQIFGGGEQGVVGKKGTSGEYEFDPRYSTTVNLKGIATAESNEDAVEGLAEAEYVYGGGNEGDVCGNTLVNLGNGRIWDAFGGASDADILGHAEVYVGRQPDGNGGYKDGFPWIRDVVFGGNDFGGTIHGEYEDDYDFEARLRDYETDKTQLHGYKAGEIPDVLKSSTYVEYLLGRADTIFGGGYGGYDYEDVAFYGTGVKMPEQHSAFVNIRPKNHKDNDLKSVFGGSTGYAGNRDGDASQDRSYVLIDINIPDGQETNFEKLEKLEVFGSGNFNGIGMGYTPAETFDEDFDLDEASAIVDLLRGKIANVYGGSYQEGITRRTVVNVPAASSIQIGNIFGGAYGVQILPPCDVYETQVNYNNTSEQAQVTGAIYGGNNNERRSLFTQVNISSPVYSNKEKGYTGTVFGAGRGIDTWSEHTEVNLLSGARVYNVYGGGEMGHVLNSASVQAYMNLYKENLSPQISQQDPYWNSTDGGAKYTIDGAGNRIPNDAARWRKDWADAWKMGDYYNPIVGSNGNDGVAASYDYTTYATNTATNLDRFSDRLELDNNTAAQLDGQKKHNTNVIINEGAVVEGYAYGGGLGDASVSLSGDIYGSTYVTVLGGEVKKDVYAGGRAGGVDNLFDADDFSDPGNKFTATANAYIQGGTARNVYGGGYEGHVGHHVGAITESYTGDRLAEAYVVIGKHNGTSFEDGIPAITRNVYGGGEGGSVYGTTHVTVNNGYVGYRYGANGANTTNGANGGYTPELDDQKPGDLELSGNVFGGGYVINSYVDSTNINMYGGTVRGSLYGGGEVGPIGRGTMKSGTYSGALQNQDAYIFRAGTTNVNMYSGHVLRNVFGGGRGKDSWGGDGTMYMDPAVVASLDMKCKGFVFGQTRVNIHGGEIGTDEGMAYGYGNVFGGCDEGSVYSAYMKDNALCIGKKLDNSERYDGDKEGYYYKYENETQQTTLTEDCKVVVAPHARALGSVSINSHSYASGAYVPIDDLNTLKSKNDDNRWQYLDPTGIIIHNAVFAGGNLAPGSTSLFANAKTVYGNATASIHDVYNRDLITIGTGHTGGLYGDGNLTFVDGYRELNITNYGTDYYHIAKSLTSDEYKELPAREQAYYELKYECIRECTDKEGTTYKAKTGDIQGATLPQDEILALFSGITSGGTGTTGVIDENGKPSSTYWKEQGVVSVYAGRIMNTIQRADFCGVFGSRMVMKGAQDRVPEQADYTNYTINRVREVSLNKKESIADDTGDNATHGNYFGIYSVVNYLGALTSDVNFGDVRKTNSSDKSIAADGRTYYEWKSAHTGQKSRNNGTCHNHLALASGVYLEITTEQSTGNTLNTKDWGPITGVVELDLINVQPGMGGGFVYAKNEHGEPTGPNGSINTLTTLNDGAATKGQYTYATADDSRYQWETSGNFIHSSQTIIDDCYNISNSYLTTNFVPAHYWYIQGSVYVYDQYISAYTGSPNAFRETVEIPITINAAANGTMTLLNVQPNRYAYYSSTKTPLVGDQKLVIGDVTYQRNTPISYWDWNKLPASERALFVSDTYVNTKAYKTSEDSEEIIAANSQVLLEQPTGELYSIAEQEMVPASEIFHSSNNMSHDTGYLLTYNVTNPDIWNKWYTPVNGGDKNQTGGDGYEDGPTYHPTASGLYGQQEYDVNAIIPEKTYEDYEALTSKPESGQATFVPAYLVTEEYTSTSQHYYPGAPVSAAITGYTSPAYVSTATIQLSPTEYIYVNDLMTADDITAYKTAYPSLETEIDDVVKPAYICTEAGLYGGSYYDNTKNYRALEAYSAMSPTDRSNFAFNYDALDLLIDPSYSGTQGHKYQYDSATGTLAGAEANPAGYSLTKPIDYTATYNGSSALTYTDANNVSHEIAVSAELLSTEFEQLPNEQRHYAAISVEASATATTVYVIKESFIHGETSYAIGNTISSETYNSLTTTEQEAYITALTFPSAVSDQTYYYCREEYQVNEKGEGVTVTSATDVTGATGGSYAARESVRLGVVIDATQYTSLPNYQKNFVIHGVSPMETSTLYVARDADINDLSTEKIITVVYQYDYEESDVDGTHITPVSERHVVNIHVKFKSGVPTVDDINAPTIVLPGTSITMRIPTVTPGAYEITGGGWEIFESPSDAESHVNGVPYTPSVDSLYWYQDGFYLAYYAKTYLGKTYSNHVPVSVANYHDLKKVMDDKKYHLHVDYDRTRLKRDSKIYINDYTASGENGLDLFKDLYDLSVLSGSPAEGSRLDGHSALNTSTETGTNIYDGTTNTKGVKAGQNLEFFLRTDIDYSVPSGSSARTWTSIGTDAQCFEGNLHGDGHTISGLDNSLFNKLCGNVYNLGVTGSFTGAGVAETGDGYVENCWISTSSTAAKTSMPVFGTPTNSSDYKQIVNSYYMEEDDATNKYTNHTGNYGIPTRKPAKAFYNGEVAYDLNGFYLYKRWSDKTNGTSGANEYKYWKPGEETPQTGYYADNMDKALCSSGYNGIKYVEERFADGDFVFAAGEIPTSEDERAYIDTEDDNKVKYFPIWPDDYIFFGQKLTYGYSAAQAHQDVPTAVVREDGRLSTSDNANRVYRAPAYYRSKAMGMAHFNPHAYLAQKEKLTDEQIEDNVTPRQAYPNMTAIDFKGHYYGANEAYGAYGLGTVTSGLPAGKSAFYPPLLDDDGLLSIQNCDETQNLVVYAPAEDANLKTYNVLDGYFTEPVYSEHYDNSKGYRLVAEASGASVHGHLVQSNLTATNDHLLVDKQDFNAPVAYSFDADHLMWYQRIPVDKEYVDLTKGWQGISIPFTAELVTTNQKGEITHFYSGSTTGHEYWLRHFTGITTDTSADPEKVTATMSYPSASADDGFSVVDKTDANTFLWNYYYSKTSRQDKNSDTYQQYYNSSRPYDDYPLLTAAKPYIIGFPGQTYYEFDLSGKFVAQNTAAAIPKLDKQFITFASETGASIGVSDDEMSGKKVTYNGTDYTFKPSYMNETLETGTDSYVLNADGDSYDKVPTTGNATNVTAFRPYFTAATSGSTREFRGVRSIVFSNIGMGDLNPGEGSDDEVTGDVEIYAKGKNIYTVSHTEENVDIRIVNASGAVMKTYVLEPGKKEVTPITAPGVYIVNKKKVFIE